MDLLVGDFKGYVLNSVV